MMSGSVNKVILVGNLGRDPEEVKHLSGSSLVRLSLATSSKYKDKETTEWHSITLFGKLAELASAYLKSGSKLYLEGRLQTRKWQDKDDNDRYTTEIIGESMTFL